MGMELYPLISASAAAKWGLLIFFVVVGSAASTVIALLLPFVTRIALARTALAEAYREAMFKQDNSEFVFREPGVIPPRHYLVSMMQKAEIQQRLQASWELRWSVVLFAALVGVVTRSDSYLIGSIVFVWVMWVFLQYAISNRIGPALVGARYTDKRIALRDRTETLSRLLSLFQMIGAGSACALSACALASIPLLLPMLVVQVRPENNLFPVLWALAAIGAFEAGYYFYLAALKVLRGATPENSVWKLK